MTWGRLREAAILAIGVILVLALLATNKQVDDLRVQVDGLKSEVVANRKASDGGRSLLCLQLRAQGQPVTEYAPCMAPAVYLRWKDEPITSLEDRLCASGTKTEGCPDGS